MEMRVQALDEKGALIENAEVLVNGVAVGRTPNAIAAVSGALWKSYIIKVRCDGYNDVQFSAVKEPKWFMIVLGFCLLWFPWLWAYGAKDLQTIVMSKKAGPEPVSNTKMLEPISIFIGKTWQDVLKENGLEQYISVFEKHKLTDLETILSLSEQDLGSIGIEALGDRKRLIRILHDNK